MKHQITQTEIIQRVSSQALNACDKPAIQEVLNNAMDNAERNGELTRARSDSWSQPRMVRRVQIAIR